MNIYGVRVYRDYGAQELKKNMIETPLIEISSTEIRQKLENGKNVSKFLHPDVLDYIKSHKLYMPND